MKAQATQDQAFVPVTLTIELHSAEEVEQLYSAFNYTPFCEAMPAIDSCDVRDALYPYRRIKSGLDTSHLTLTERAEASFKRVMQK